MKNVKILPYNKYSASSANLTKELGIVSIRLQNSSLKGRKSINVINWGNTTLEDFTEVEKCTVLNPPEVVKGHSNKVKFFEKYGVEDFVIPWTLSKEKAVEWMASGNIVVARTKVSSHSGEGIVLMMPDDPSTWVEAPLYTLYKKKKSEFRIHFLGKKIIDMQKKAVKEGTPRENINWQIRNHQNGFVYIRNFGELPADVSSVSNKFIEKTDLDFGAIDIIYNEQEDKAYILEVNTAPGLTGTTLSSYVEAFKEYFGDQA